MSDVTGDRCCMALPDGRLISLLEPDPRLIRLADIALGLSVQVRWGGFGRRRITVAEHSVLAAQAALYRSLGPETAAKALLHDAHEFLLRDLGPSMKHLLPGYVEACQRLQRAIEAALGVQPPTAAQAAEIKRIDWGLQLLEIRDGYAPAVDLGLERVCIENLPGIVGFDQEGARWAFLAQAEALGVGSMPSVQG